MVAVASLWLPILLSAVLVFVVSSIIHMALGYHRTDFRKLEKESEVIAALRPLGISPGEYIVPFMTSPAEMKSPEYLEKLSKGPVAFMTVLKNGPLNMTANLVNWFIYCVVVSIFAGYVAGVALGPGAPYLSVFRFVGTVAFAGYALALWQNSIWYARAVSTNIKNTFDGLVYALATAGVFGWLWPS